MAEGQTIDVEKLPAEVGSTVELGRVLLLADGEEMSSGTPLVEGAKVMATVAAQSRDKKIIVFKYKSKVRYRRKTGHRQSYTRLTIDKIVAASAEGEKHGT